MKKLMKRVIGFYIDEHELDISMFKLLGTAGILVSLIGAVQDIFTSSDYTGTIINLLAALASVLLIWFVHTTRLYLVGYLITSVGIFSILFAWLFLETGGMNGSIPYFFAFGMVFTLLMYKGVLMYVMEILQTLFYVAVCWFSYKYPEYVTPFENAEKQFFDQMAGILFSAVGIGAIFLMYIREYRKQQRIAEESSKAKSELLANISHEVRTPINMLLGMNEMILRESESTRINEYAQNVDNAGRQLLFMVNQFLDLSRIDMGKERLFEENFNIRKSVRALALFFGKEAERKGLEFVFDVDKKLLQNYCGDIQKISQILTNLLTNALKYTEKGTIVLSVQTLEDENHIRFEVSDTGSGIEQKDCEKIFESFERADIIRNRSIEGTGLGLAISSKLANLMDTKIEVKSRYGVGSVFWFDVQLKTGEDSAAYAESNGFFIAPEAKILAVDDNNMNLMVLKSLLKRTMVAVDTADSAEDCYDKYAAKDYDLVLMDYMMPDIDGIEAMEHLRDMDRAKKRKVPVIVLTADATPEKKQMFFDKGFDDYLLKPIDSVLLENALLKHLPAQLVTQVNGDVQAEVPDEVRRSLDNLLKQHDISFELALKHLSGDILQMARIAEYFIKNTAETVENLKTAIANDDFEKAAILVHSIKGNAGNVGAEDLFYSARRLERRANYADKEYVISALPLFIMKWNRVIEGLKEFLAEFEKIRPSLVKEETSEEKPREEQDIRADLLEAVQLGNQSPALKFVDELEAVRGKDEVFDRIRDYITSIEFEKAEALIRDI